MAKGLDFRRMITVTFSVFGLILILFSYQLISSSQRIEKDYGFILDIIMEKRLLIQSLESTMLQARGYEKNFLISKEITAADKLRSTVKKMQLILDSLINVEHQISDHYTTLNGETDKDDQVVKISNLKKSVNAYLMGFNTVISLTTEKGIDEESGLRGRLRTAAHDLEDIIETYSTDTVMVRYLTLRRKEKDYLLRENEKYRVQTGDRSTA